MTMMIWRSRRTMTMRRRKTTMMGSRMRTRSL
jgi:hypothetical protein